LAGPIVAQLFGFQAPHPQGAQAQGVVPFGQAGAGLVGEQRAVAEPGWFEPKGPVEEQLPGGRFEQVFASDYLGDVHGGIIHHYRKLIGGQVIMTPDHKISEVFSSYELLRRIESVNKPDRLAIGHAETPVAASAWQSLAGVFHGWPASAGIKRFVLAGVGRLQGA
jgi:hypothetical protein